MGLKLKVECMDWIVLISPMESGWSLPDLPCQNLSAGEAIGIKKEL